MWEEGQGGGGRWEGQGGGGRGKGEGGGGGGRGKGKGGGEEEMGRTRERSEAPSLVLSYLEDSAPYLVGLGELLLINLSTSLLLAHSTESLSSSTPSQHVSL